MRFEEMLEFAFQWPIEKIWMDIKNLNPNNVHLVLNRLNYLNERFKLKEKAIVESSMISSDFSILSDAGYHCSYFVPTHYATLTAKKKMRVGNEIALQTKNQKISAISFDISLYPFIKEFVEPKISNSIVYHSWKIKGGFHDANLIQELKESPLFNDERVRTFVVKYPNDFEL